MTNAALIEHHATIEHIAQAHLYYEALNSFSSKMDEERADRIKQLAALTAVVVADRIETMLATLDDDVLEDAFTLMYQRVAEIKAQREFEAKRRAYMKRYYAGL
jgi:hypothetical protein